MDDVVIGWFIVVIGAGEMLAGVVMHHRGGQLADNEKAGRKRRLSKAGLFLSLSGGLTALAGLYVVKFGLP